jgi:hypothetical protein
MAKNKKTGNRIRYKGIYRLFRNGTPVKTTQYDLTHAFGSTPAITVEQLQLMTSQDIEARAEAMFEAMTDKCSDMEIKNLPILFGGCVDYEKKVIGGSPQGSEDRYPLDFGGEKAIWVFYSVDGDVMITDVDSLSIPCGATGSFTVTVFPSDKEWFVSSYDGLGDFTTRTGDTVTINNEQCDNTTRKIQLRWGTGANHGNIGKEISITLLNT